MHTITRRFALALAGAAMLAAPLASAQNATVEPTKGGTLVIGSTQVPRHLNGAVQSGIATALPSAQIFASPLRYDDAFNPQPYLAESYEVSEDGLSVTLKLADAKFHDGKPVTSADVAFSIETVKANHPFKTMFEPVESVETPDEKTAVIKLSKPHPAILLAMSPALLPILPKHVYGDGQDAKTHPANNAPIGAGPFKLEEYRPGEQITLVRNEDFFLEGKPYLDKIVVRIVKDPNALLIAMENGETDMYPFVAGSRDIRRLEKADGVSVTDKGYAAIGPINWLAFNTVKAPFDDVRVRQAIAYAVDRDFITKALMGGVSAPQRGPIIESSPFFDASVETYDVDIDKANALLDEAGLTATDGTRAKVTVDYIPGPAEQQKNVAEYLKSQLKKVGLDVEVRSAPDFPTWAKRVSTGDFDMTMDVVFNWGDPVIGVHRTYLSSNIKPGVIWSNTQGYENAKVDELLNAAAVETDQEKRKALYAEFQQILSKDVPIYYINATPYRTAYNERVGNVPESIWGTMSPMDEVFIKPSN